MKGQDVLYAGLSGNLKAMAHNIVQAMRENKVKCLILSAQWDEHGARINCISAGIIYTPLTYDKLTSSERVEFYRNMLAKSPAKRGST